MNLEELKSLSSERQQEIFLDIDDRRTKAKTTNFATTYNAQIPKIASLLKGDVPLATKLFDVYWKRNWAIKEIERNVEIQNIRGKLWMYNPVSRFWYFLENRKDVFSLLNQSTGSYVFNTFLSNTIQVFKQQGIFFKQQLQYHDEFLFLIKEGDVSIAKKAVEEGMKKTNDCLKLNVVFGYDAKTGEDYAEVH